MAMNLNQIFNLLTRMFLRKAVNYGMRKGMEIASRRAPDAKPETEAERAQARAGQDMAKRARDLSKITRRLGR